MHLYTHLYDSRTRPKITMYIVPWIHKREFINFMYEDEVVSQRRGSTGAALEV